MGYKAERTANIVKDFTGIDVKFENKKYENQKLQGVVVLAVDSMDTRRRIYENCQKTEDVSLIVDPRTGGETFRIYTINPHSAKDRKFYEKYLYSDNVVAPIPCTAQAIIYNVLAVSALICNQIKRYLMAQPYNIEILADTGNCMLLTK
jgi:molybdopterin/thiamine biosynthesis adenylyltransferase